MHKYDDESYELYNAALMLRSCAGTHDDDTMLIGNVKASTIKKICSDYARLRLQEGLYSPKNETDKE